jgi:hypothetical protein
MARRIRHAALLLAPMFHAHHTPVVPFPVNATDPFALALAAAGRPDETADPLKPPKRGPQVSCEALVGRGFVDGYRANARLVCAGVTNWVRPGASWGGAGVVLLERARIAAPPVASTRAAGRARPAPTSETTYAVQAPCTPPVERLVFGKAMYQAMRYSIVAEANATNASSCAHAARAGPASRDDAPALVVDQPIVLHLTDGSANLWHAAHALLGTLISCLIARVEPTTAALFLPDNRTSSVSALYAAFFANVTVGAPPPGCYRDVVLGSTEAFFPAHFWQSIACNRSSIAAWLARSAWSGLGMPAQPAFDPWLHLAPAANGSGARQHAALLLDREVKLSGQKVTGRLIKNKDALRDAITGHFGATWRALDLATLPLTAQIELLARSSVIVGVHGAAFTLLLFANAGTTAIGVPTRAARPARADERARAARARAALRVGPHPSYGPRARVRPLSPSRPRRRAPGHARRDAPTHERAVALRQLLPLARARMPPVPGATGDDCRRRARKLANKRVTLAQVLDQQ